MSFLWRTSFICINRKFKSSRLKFIYYWNSNILLSYEFSFFGLIILVKVIYVIYTYFYWYNLLFFIYKYFFNFFIFFIYDDYDLIKLNKFFLIWIRNFIIFYIRNCYFIFIINFINGSNFILFISIFWFFFTFIYMSE